MILDQDTSNDKNKNPYSYDLFCARAPYLRLLPRNDRQLMELLLPGQMTIRGVAVLLRKNPGIISRKASKIRMRLNHPVARALVLSGAELTPKTLRVARERFVSGKSPTNISHNLGISVNQVRLLIRQILKWAFLCNKARDPKSEFIFA